MLRVSAVLVGNLRDMRNSPWRSPEPKLGRIGLHSQAIIEIQGSTKSMLIADAFGMAPRSLRVRAAAPTRRGDDG